MRLLHMGGERTSSRPIPLQGMGNCHPERSEGSVPRRRGDGSFGCGHRMTIEFLSTPHGKEIYSVPPPELPELEPPPIFDLSAASSRFSSSSSSSCLNFSSSVSWSSS